MKSVTVMQMITQEMCGSIIGPFSGLLVYDAYGTNGFALLLLLLNLLALATLEVFVPQSAGCAHLPWAFWAGCSEALHTKHGDDYADGGDTHRGPGGSYQSGGATHRFPRVDNFRDWTDGTTPSALPGNKGAWWMVGLGVERPRKEDPSVYISPEAEASRGLLSGVEGRREPLGGGGHLAPL